MKAGSITAAAIGGDGYLRSASQRRREGSGVILRSCDAATTTAQDPTCQGNLGIDVIVKNTILAVSLRKTGDAARFMSQFQDVTQCLPREGTRGVEFALAMYVHRAVTVLPPAQAQIAVQGVMNLGMQIFDELQYTGQSW